MIRLFRVCMQDDAAGAVASVLRSGYIGEGNVVQEFEVAFAEAVRAPRRVLATSSCTAALALAYQMVGITSNEAVVVTPLTCFATVAPLLSRGARIIWVDVDPATGLMIPEDAVAKALRYGARAIVAVDWGGRIADYEALHQAGIPVIQDAAHDGLAPILDGPHGDYVCWSFQAIKFLTTGDGGALLCPNEERTERARLARWYGLDREKGDSFRCSQNITVVGHKYHMNNIAAAIGLANLSLAREMQERQRQHSRYLAAMGLGLAPRDRDGAWLHTVLVRDPISYRQNMARYGVEVSPVHARCDQHSVVQAFTWSGAELPGVDSFAAHQVNLPIGWGLTNQDLDIVARSANMADCAIKEAV